MVVVSGGKDVVEVWVKVSGVVVDIVYDAL